MTPGIGNRDLPPIRMEADADVRIHEADLRVIEPGQDRLEVLRMPDVVVVELRDEGRPCEAERRVACRAGARLPLVANNPQPRVVNPAERLRDRRRRAIIRDDQLERGKRLGGNLDVSRTVACESWAAS